VRILILWELILTAIAALFPVAMLELTFGMLAIPVLLLVLAPNSSSRGEAETSSNTSNPSSSVDEINSSDAASSSGDASPTSSTLVPQILEVGVQMRSVFTCLGLIFAINLLPLVVQVSPGLIEACTVVMFVILGHLLLRKTALVHKHLQAQKQKNKEDEDCSPTHSEPTTNEEPESETVPDTPIDTPWDDADDDEMEFPSGMNVENQEADEPDEDKDLSEEPMGQEPTDMNPKLMWADVEEDDEFQHHLAKNQPKYETLTTDDLEKQKTEGSRSADGSRRRGGNEKRRREGGGKGSGKGGENSERSNSSAITAKIRACGRNGDLQGALEGVEEALAAGIQNSTEVQNALLYALVHCGEASGSSAGELFEKMKDTKQADIVSFNIMLRALLDAGKHDDAKKLLNDMGEHGLTANKVTLNELLGDRVKAKDTAGMWRVFDEMRSSGFGVTNVACSLALKALNEGTHRSEVKKTLALLDELVEPMDEALCSSAIEACLRVKELTMASDFMANLGTIKAKNKGLGLSPATYGSMIKAHGQARDLNQTWATWNAMFKNGTSPSAVTFGCMVEALVMNGTVDDAWKLVHDMLSNEEHAECVNTVIYSTVMKGFSHTRRPEMCFAVLDEMHTRGVEANTITYNTLLDACAKCSAMARVPQVFEEMKTNRVEPDKITYSTLIKGYCMVGDLDCAFDLFEEMKADGKVGLDEIVYNALIDGCGRQQKVQRAMQVLDDMRGAKIPPSNYTLSILVKLLGRAHKLNEAIALVDDFRSNYRVRPNVQVYTCLMQACLLNKRVGQALSVYNKMVTELRCLPDQKAYSVLLSGCLQANALKEAVQVARCAYLLPGKDLVSSRHEDGIVGVEHRIMQSLDSRIRSAELDEDVTQDWDEVFALSGCRSGGHGGDSKGKGSGKDGKGQRDGKGAGKDRSSGKGSGKDGKSFGKDGRNSGKDGKGFGKDKHGKDGSKDNRGSGKSRGKGKDANDSWYQ
jgi:pentatricopeptide repeat protein